MKLDHLGFITHNLEEALHVFHQLGYEDMYSEIRHHEPKNLHTMRVRLGDTVAEVMEPADPSKPSFVDGGFETGTAPIILHHLCYSVDDIRKTFDELLATGEYTVYEDITNGVFQKNLIGFLHHKTMGYIEFFEWPKEV